MLLNMNINSHLVFHNVYMVRVVYYCVGVLVKPKQIYDLYCHDILRGYDNFMIPNQMIICSCFKQNRQHDPVETATATD